MNFRPLLFLWCALSLATVFLAGCGEGKSDKTASDLPVPEEKKSSQDTSSDKTSDSEQASKQNTEKSDARELAQYVPNNSLAAIVVRPAKTLATPGLEVTGEFLERLSYTGDNTLQSRSMLLRGVGLKLADVEQAIYVVDAIRKPRRFKEGDELGGEVQAALSLYGPLVDAYVLRFKKEIPDFAVNSLLYRPKRVEFADKSYFGQGSDVDAAAACKLDSRTALFGSERAVRKMLAARKGEPGDFRTAIQNANSERDVVLVVNTAAIQSAFHGELMSAPTAKLIFESTNLTTLEIDVAPQVAIHLCGETADAQSARNVKSAIEELIVTAKQNMPPIDQVRNPVAKLLVETASKGLNALKISVSERELTIDAVDLVTFDELRQIITNVISRPRRPLAASYDAAVKVVSTGDAAAIRALIPMAAAMSTETMTHIAVSDSLPELPHFRDQPLSLSVLRLQSVTEDVAALYPGLADEFKFGSDGEFPIVPKPQELAQSLVASAWLGGCSMIQPEYITKLTCDVDGDRARGFVRFESFHFIGGPLYQGQVNYLAARHQGTWQIVEFEFPVRKWKFTLGDDGNWTWTTPFGNYGQARSQPVEVRVVIDGEPAANCIVDWFHLESPSHWSSGRPRENGIVKAEMLKGRYRVRVRGEGIAEEYQKANTSELDIMIDDETDAVTIELKTEP
jgi:hypothetical protein